jgi:signal transduction histidine kinase/CheY-like chemotaxis protein
MKAPRFAGAAVALLLAFGCARPGSAHVPSTAPLSETQHAWIKQHPVVRYTTEGGWLPLVDIQHGQPAGLLTLYLKHFEESTGLRFEYVPSTSWDDALSLLASGQVDMLPGMSHFHSGLVKQDHLLSRTFLSGSLVLIGRADAGVAFGLSDLAGKRVAMPGQQMAMVPADKLQGVRIVRTGSIEETLAAVAEHRADYLIGLEAIHPAFVRSRFIGKLGMAGTLDAPPLEAKIAVGPDQHELLGILDWAIGQLSNEETDLIFEEAATQIQYGAPTLRSLWRYRSQEIVLLALLIVGLVAAALISLQARRQAQRSEQGKARFLAMMSHEIRTPINVIVGSLEALQRQQVDGMARRLVDTMGLASDALIDLLDNVLDLSKLEAGKMNLERVAANPSELLHSVTRLMAIRAESRGLQLRLALDALPTDTLQLDTIRLRQVLSNLLGNAIKFTDRGSITVHARREIFDGRPWLRVDVCDTGVGIALADQARLFQPYVQADSSSTRRFGGTGLGLAICHELIALMEGAIWLQSEPGKGTRISFRVPWLPSPSALSSLHAPEDADVGAAPLAHLTVLVCDDNPLNRDVISQQLKSLGASVTMVDSGEQALAYLREKTVDLLLLDCHMPGMDGYETARRARQEIDGHLPIFAVSAASDATHLQRCLEVEISAVLRKPVRTRELMGLLVLWDLVETAQDEDAGGEPERQTDDLSPGSYLLDDLQQAQLAAVSGETDNLRHHLHRITGSAAMFDLTEIECESRRLEDEARNSGNIGDLAVLNSLIRAHADS